MAPRRRTASPTLRLEALETRLAPSGTPWLSETFDTTAAGGQPAPADVEVTAAVQLNSLIPAQVLARGSGLNTATPTYYALSLTRGLDLQLLRVVNGSATVLADLPSAAWFSDQWVQATLQVS